MIFRKIIFTFSLVMVLMIGRSQQVLLNEDFSSWPPQNWTILSGPGSDATGTGVWHSYYNTGAYVRYVNSTMMHNEWLITPFINVPTAGQDVVKLNWIWAAEYFSYFVGSTIHDPDLKVKISIDSGATWQMLWVEDDSAMVVNSGVTDWPWIDEKDYLSEIDITQYAGNNIKVAFQLKGQYPMLYFKLDNVSVIKQSPIDAELKKITTKPYFLPGNVDIKGEIENVGVQAINSFDVSYNINSGTESAVFSVSGLSLANGDTYSFTHNIPYNFTADGTYTINLTVSNVNGGGESQITNNVLSKDIVIDHLYIPKRTIFEEFTGSTCSACVILANNTLDSFFVNKVVPEEYTLIKYQMDFPGAGDPYYTSQCGVRAGLYDVHGIPFFVMDGSKVPHGSVMAQGTEAFFQYYEDNKEYSASMSIMANHILDIPNKNLDVTVKINSKETYSNVKLFVAIVEKQTTGNVGSNGQTEFDQVFMKMLPTASGKYISLTANQQSTFQISGNLNGTFIEDMNDLEVIVFVQKVNKTMLQSTISGTPAGIKNINIKKVSIYPNPANDAITIKNAKNAYIKIIDLQGRVLVSDYCSDNNIQFDVSYLSKGVYFVQIMFKNSIKTKKIIIE